MRTAEQRAKFLAYQRAYNSSPERKEKKRQQYFANRELRLKQAREYRIANRQKMIDYLKQWRLNNPEKYREGTERWRKANPEKVRAFKAKSKLKNREQIRAYNRKYQKEHPEVGRNSYLRMRADPVRWERAKRVTAEYAKLHPEVRQKCAKNYALNHPEARHNYHRKKWATDPDYKIAMARRYHERRARLKGSEINPKAIDDFMKAVKSKTTATCHYCQRLVSTKSIHFDHMLPLSRGGRHSVDNLCVACATCNLSKNSKLVHEWIKHGQQLLPI